MPSPSPPLSTSDARRRAVVDSAVTVFGESGYHGTPVAAVAAHAGISPAYVFKLFPSKESLFVAALDRCFELIHDALDRGAEESADSSPGEVLSSMGGAYAALISDRTLLMLQVHAQSVASVAEIRDALLRGIRQTTTFIKSRSNASDDAVQQFIAFGQLCHLIATTGLDEDHAPWTEILTHNIRHL